MDHMEAFSKDATMQKGLGCTVLTLAVSRVLSALDFSQAHVASPTVHSQFAICRLPCPARTTAKSSWR